VITRGSFAPKVDFTGNNAPADRVAIGDFDGDGKPDFAVVNLHGNNGFRIAENTALQASSQKIHLPPGLIFRRSRPMGVATADLDGDGSST